MGIKKIKDWKMFSKVLALVLTALVPLLLLIVLYLIPLISKSLYEEKGIETKKVVEVVVNILNDFNSKVESNQMTLPDAQKQALEMIKNLRYDGKEYFWINDLQANMIMHPIQPELDGKNMSGEKDPNGKYIFSDMVKICRDKGEGLITYMWPKPGHDKPVPKISYVKLFDKWGWIVGSGIYVDDVESSIYAITGNVFLILFIVIGIIITSIYFISKKITRPLIELREAANKVAEGDVDVSIVSNSNDEIGQLEKSFVLLIADMKLQAQAAHSISSGNLDIVLKPKSTKDILAISLIEVITTLKNLVEELKNLTGNALNGNLAQRGDASKFQGGYKDIVNGVNTTLDAVIAPIKEGSNVLEQLAKGDLTVKMTGDYRGDYQIIKNSINSVAESLSNTISEVTEAVSATASASNEISSSTEEMASGANEQSAQTTEIASAVEEMTKTILENSRNASYAAETAKMSGDKAKQGGLVVQQTILGMNRISEVVSKSAEKVFTLGKNSDKIGEIIQVIDDIADQTNLLALNAAIEAARAGDQGRGFAVVADEVRKLAERTTKATKEIAEMIKEIQKETASAVESIGQGTSEVEKGKVSAVEAGKVLQEIIEGAQKVSDIATQVAAASEEQSSASEQISKNIEGISNVTQQSTLAIQQIARAAENMNKLTANLQEMISGFKLDKQISNYAVRKNGKIVHA